MLLPNALSILCQALNVFKPPVPPLNFQSSRLQH